MRITFEQVQEHGIQGKERADRAHGARDAENREKRADAAGAYAVNIGSQDMRAQGGTYKKEDMTAEEISMQAGQMDMDVQKMYMAVMSNSMSEEDFNKMLEDGYDVSDVDVETMVTILDQIKVAVAKGGGEITGFTDGLSKETLEQILGSTAYAEALENGLEEGAAAYMVEKQMPPTPENIYRAKYSAGTYQGRKEEEVPERESPDGKAFWDQIDRVIEEAGLAKNEESREDAVFLLKHDIALTEENLQLYEKLKEFRQGGEKISEEELKYRIGMQVYEGKAAFQADLSRKESIYEQAVSLYEAVQNLPQDAAEHALENCAGGKKLTLRDILESAGEAGRTSEENAGLNAPTGQDAEEAGAAGTENSVLKGPVDQPSEADGAVVESAESRELLTARRQLEEVRLRMTVEANVKLLRSGFQIDTAPMEALIERLRAAEETLAGQGIVQAAEALEKLDDLRGMPAAALSYAVSREISFTIEALHEKGSELQGDFERADAEQIKRQEAGKRYETMQTEVRPDLGDSIRKAFRNVDDILTDMNREPSEENRRAVRMLGYNRLEINEENLERALEMDGRVQRLFRDMKPGKVLQMIRDGVDVLHTDIEELTSRLTDRSESFLEESEDFARFLYKLDKNGGITAQERESYIGIYRLVRQVEKSDGRAQGYLLGSEAELTMENLLSAVRSSKKGSMDYKIDENFAGVDALQKGKSIIDQINAVPYENPRGYEETMRVIEEPQQKMRQSAQREAAEFLQEAGEPVTVSNLAEASSVLQEEVGIYQRLEEYGKLTEREDALEAEQSRFESCVAALQDAVTDEDSLQEGMEVFAEQAEEILRDAKEQAGVTELDIRDMQRLYRGIRFRTALSRESRYQIPVKTESGYTVMNLTVKKGTGTAQAEISMETEKYGRLEALFTERKGEQTADADGGQLEGTLFAETADGTKLLEDAVDRIKERMESAGISVNDMAVLRGSRRGRGSVSRQADGPGAETSAKKDGRKEISAGELYQMAKIFLETVRNEW